MSGQRLLYVTQGSLTVWQNRRAGPERVAEFGERVALAGSNAGRFDINPPACEMTQYRGCHGRTNGVAGAYKKNSARQIAASAQRISPSSEERKGA